MTLVMRWRTLSDEGSKDRTLPATSGKKETKKCPLFIPQPVNSSRSTRKQTYYANFAAGKQPEPPVWSFDNISILFIELISIIIPSINLVTRVCFRCISLDQFYPLINITFSPPSRCHIIDSCYSFHCKLLNINICKKLYNTLH